MAVNPMTHEQVWFDKYRTEDAEVAYQERNAGCGSSSAPSQAQPQQQNKGSSLANEIARARQQIKNSLNNDAAFEAPADSSVQAKIESLEKENQELRQVTQNLAAVCKTLEERICALEKAGTTNNHNKAPAQPAAAAKKDEPKKEECKDDEEDDEDDFELFGSDDEENNEAAEKVKQQRVDAYNAKKSKKPALIAKSSLLLDVKPWDDETDMEAMEKCVRSIEMDGLLWGASKLAPVGYGIRKLVINAVVEDDKVSTDDLEEKIVAFEDYVQSMDIAAFNKI